MCVQSQVERRREDAAADLLAQNRLSSPLRPHTPAEAGNDLSSRPSTPAPAPEQGAWPVVNAPRTPVTSQRPSPGVHSGPLHSSPAVTDVRRRAPPPPRLDISSTSLDALGPSQPPSATWISAAAALRSATPASPVPGGDRAPSPHSFSSAVPPGRGADPRLSPAFRAGSPSGAYREASPAGREAEPARYSWLPPPRPSESGATSQYGTAVGAQGSLTSGYRPSPSYQERAGHSPAAAAGGAAMFAYPGVRRISMSEFLFDSQPPAPARAAGNGGGGGVVAGGGSGGRVLILSSPAGAAALAASGAVRGAAHTRPTYAAGVHAAENAPWASLLSMSPTGGGWAAGPASPAVTGRPPRWDSQPATPTVTSATPPPPHDDPSRPAPQSRNPLVDHAGFGWPAPRYEPQLSTSSAISGRPPPSPGSLLGSSVKVKPAARSPLTAMSEPPGFASNSAEFLLGEVIVIGESAR